MNNLLTSRLIIEQLQLKHLPELAELLRLPAVYEHIGGIPSLSDFILDRERALQGPKQDISDERWLNYLVRENPSNLMLGRLEATIHGSIAEVAFLFAPQHWGKGYAFEALRWLHSEILSAYGISDFWATTSPANTRCQSLLVRCGYLPKAGKRPHLYSFDEGDCVYHLCGAA